MVSGGGGFSWLELFSFAVFVCILHALYMYIERGTRAETGSEVGESTGPAPG